MFLHTVLFYAKPDLSAAERAALEKGIRSLTTIASVRFAFLGTPAATRRPVIDHTYDYELVVGFDNQSGHDHYQEVELHRRFVAECAGYWTRVQIYDAESLSGPG
jgi:hypothetical protein